MRCSAIFADCVNIKSTFSWWEHVGTINQFAHDTGIIHHYIDLYSIFMYIQLVFFPPNPLNLPSRHYRKWPRWVFSDNSVALAAATARPGRCWAALTRWSPACRHLVKFGRRCLGGPSLHDSRPLPPFFHIITLETLEWDIVGFLGFA